MLRLLLDEHVSPHVAEGLRQRRKAVQVTALADWEGGRYLGMPDDAILKAAATQKLTLVTYDRRTIPPLLKSWTEAGRAHAGVIFVDDKTIAHSDLEALICALNEIAIMHQSADSTNAVSLLRRTPAASNNPASPHYTNQPKA